MTLQKSDGGDCKVALRRTPPARIYLRWCPVCDRTDRVGRLADNHYIAGKQCRGVLRELCYALEADRG